MGGMNQGEANESEKMLKVGRETAPGKCMLRPEGSPAGAIPVHHKLVLLPTCATIRPANQAIALRVNS
jgi:hypothetical protein